MACYSHMPIFCWDQCLSSCIHHTHFSNPQTLLEHMLSLMGRTTLGSQNARLSPPFLILLTRFPTALSHHLPPTIPYNKPLSRSPTQIAQHPPTSPLLYNSHPTRIPHHMTKVTIRPLLWPDPTTTHFFTLYSQTHPQYKESNSLSN